MPEIAHLRAEVDYQPLKLGFRIGAQYFRDASRAVPRLAEAATNIPFVGKMTAGAWSAGDEVARSAEMRRRVGQALLGDASDPNVALRRRTELARLIASQMTPGATTAGAASALYFTR